MPRKLSFLLLSFVLFFNENSSKADCNKEISDVQNSVESFLAWHERPEELLVIFDVDGTLTSEPTPNDDVSATPRRDAISLVQDLKARGVKLLAASAWKYFPGTIARINEIGLGEAFEVPLGEQNFNLLSAPFTSPKGELLKLEYYRSGLAASARIKGKRDRNFRKKALAPLFVFTPQELQSFKKVILADDSQETIDIFAADAKEYQIFGNATYDLICLAPPHEESASFHHGLASTHSLGGSLSSGTRTAEGSPFGSTASFPSLLIGEDDLLSAPPSPFTGLPLLRL